MSGEERGLVHIVDDDDSLREALARRLGVAGHAVACYASAREFLDVYVPSEAPSCLLLDVKMPGMGGLELQRLLRERGVGLPIVFLTAYGDVPQSVRALKWGASDFLLKPARDEALLAAVQSALAQSVGRVVIAAERRDAGDRYGQLSPREREIFQLVAQGMPNKHIADRLGLAEITVKVHRAAVMRKMGVDSAAALVRLAVLLEGLGGTPPP